MRTTRHSSGQTVSHAIKLALLLCACIFGLLACTSTRMQPASEPPLAYKSFTGFIQYPNNLYFPSRIKVEIAFQAIGRFSGETRTLTLQTIRNPQKFPLGFISRYAPDDIHVGDAHVLNVRVFQENSSEPYLLAKNIPIDLVSTANTSIVVMLTDIDS